MKSILRDVKMIRDYLEWQQALNGGGSSEMLHRQLITERRPYPSRSVALAAIKRIENAVKYDTTV